MMKLMSWVLALVLMPLTSFAEETYTAGKDYILLDTALPTQQPDKIEVAEVFWYGCPHCYAFKPIIEAWEKTLPEDVDFVLLPAALGRAWVPHAYAFYAVSALGQLDKTHTSIFDALARDHKNLNDADAFADFLVKDGVDPAAFRKAYTSFGVKSRMDQAQAKIRGAISGGVPAISGVPALIINGKYVVNGTLAGSHENMLKITDFLIQKERSK